MKKREREKKGSGGGKEEEVEGQQINIVGGVTSCTV